jgi:hypothetical protein
MKLTAALFAAAVVSIVPVCANAGARAPRTHAWTDHDAVVGSCPSGGDIDAASSYRYNVCGNVAVGKRAADGIAAVTPFGPIVLRPRDTTRFGAVRVLNGHIVLPLLLPPARQSTFNSVIPRGTRLAIAKDGSLRLYGSGSQNVLVGRVAAPLAPPNVRADTLPTAPTAPIQVEPNGSVTVYEPGMPDDDSTPVLIDVTYLAYAASICDTDVLTCPGPIAVPLQDNAGFTCFDFAYEPTTSYGNIQGDGISVCRVYFGINQVDGTGVRVCVQYHRTFSLPLVGTLFHYWANYQCHSNTVPPSRVYSTAEAYPSRVCKGGSHYWRDKATAFIDYIAGTNFSPVPDVSPGVTLGC